jgi:HK97 family phage prohead protease
MSDDVMLNEYPDDEQRYAICNAQKVKFMNSKLTIPLQIKSLNKMEFEGYGSIFGNKDWGNDIVMPGAFQRTLSEYKSEDTLPMMFWMHDPSRIPGKWIEMSEDDNGLYVKGILADTELGREIHTLLSMKAVSGLSIGYMTKLQDFLDDGIRLIKDVDLFETSIVSIPMNPKAQIVHAKSRLSERGEYVPTHDEVANLKRECEQFLRTKGFSKRLSVAYVSNMFKEPVGNPLEPDVISEQKQDDKKEESYSVTPEDLEVNAGLTSFKEKMLLQDLDKLFNEVFKYE